MGLVVSFADARAAMVKATLSEFAELRCPVLVETADDVIDARRIFCRDTVAVLIDRYGYQTRVGYAEITDVSPVLPMAEVIAIAGPKAVEQEPQAAAETAIIVPFPPNRS
jgi:hypothetical protein